MKTNEELRKIYNKIGTCYVHINNAVDLSLDNTDKEHADYIRNEIKILSDLVDELYLYGRKK